MKINCRFGIKAPGPSVLAQYALENIKKHIRVFLRQDHRRAQVENVVVAADRIRQHTFVAQGLDNVCGISGGRLSALPVGYELHRDKEPSAADIPDTSTVFGNTRQPTEQMLPDVQCVLL